MDSPRVCAIGDIHGNAALLKQLLQGVEKAGEWDFCVFLGDYIDRGSQSCEVVETLLEWQSKHPQKVHFLKGNHEQWMLEAYRSPQSTSWILGMNGLETIRSYSPDFAEEFKASLKALGPQIFQKKEKSWKLPFETFFQKILPPNHLRFFLGLENYFLLKGKLLCVHAGVQPGVPLEQQEENDLFWIGEVFHQGYKGKETVLFGHFFSGDLRNDQKPLPYIGANSIIGIDTGSEKTGVLTAYFWPDGTILSTAND